jgi:glucuronoarabinoxylan endo-1,4-beta-xylanase
VRKLKALLGLLLLFGAGFSVFWLFVPHTATVDWTDIYQQIDGFGAASVDLATLEAIPDAQADMFFDPIKGIGLSFLRTEIMPDGSSLDVVTAQKAVARGARVWATPWSPPAKYKTNGDVTHGGYLVHSDYAAWADVMAQYVKMMQSKGIPIYAISVQNEPNFDADYRSCLYTAQDLHDFVPYLFAALQSAGVGNTKIIVAEQSAWSINLARTAMEDPVVMRDIGIIAAHDYSGKIRPYRTGSTHLWQSEVFDTESTHFDGNITDGLKWASNIHHFLTVANVNAWHWWTLTTDTNDNEGLTDVNINPAKRMYVLGQWSKFVRPGWSRIGVSYFGRLQVTAFKDPANQKFVIVAINSSTHAVSQTFSLNGFSTDSVTPWITSDSLSLAAQPPIHVSGTNFAYTLPASSVTTFLGTLP